MHRLDKWKLYDSLGGPAPSRQLKPGTFEEEEWRRTSGKVLRLVAQPPRQRICLRCDKPFKSNAISNRLCPFCGQYCAASFDGR